MLSLCHAEHLIALHALVYVAVVQPPSLRDLVRVNLHLTTTDVALAATINLSPVALGTRERSPAARTPDRNSSWRAGRSPAAASRCDSHWWTCAPVAFDIRLDWR